MSQRITECELGPIHHRPTTALSRPTRCPCGHVAPRYASQGRCVACVKLRYYEWLAAKGRIASVRDMRRFRDYGEALAHHFDIGGYLLCLEDGQYGVTDNSRVVRRLRGAAWMDHCDIIECWDEAAIMAHANTAKRA